MSNLKINRDHNGKRHLEVGGQYAQGATVSHMTQVGEDLVAVVFVPMKHCTLGEVNNVVPFPVVARR